MNPIFSIGIWLIEHLSLSRSRHSLCGDLLQQKHSGRNAVWLTREVLAALGFAIAQRFGRYGIPLLLSALWSALYRGYALPQKVALDLGWSSLLKYSLVSPIAHVLLQILPVITFVWFGLAVFASVRRDVLRHLSVPPFLSPSRQAMRHFWSWSSSGRKVLRAPRSFPCSCNAPSTSAG